MTSVGFRSLRHDGPTIPKPDPDRKFHVHKYLPEPLGNLQIGLEWAGEASGFPLAVLLQVRAQSPEGPKDHRISTPTKILLWFFSVSHSVEAPPTRSLALHLEA
jgi:hypothetical protein